MSTGYTCDKCGKRADMTLYGNHYCITHGAKEKRRREDPPTPPSSTRSFLKWAIPIIVVIIIGSLTIWVTFEANSNNVPSVDNFGDDNTTVIGDVTGENNYNNQGSGNQFIFTNSTTGDIFNDSTIIFGASPEEMKNVVEQAIRDNPNNENGYSNSQIEPLVMMLINPFNKPLMLASNISDAEISNAYLKNDGIDFLGPYHIVKKIIDDDTALLLVIEGQKGTVPILIWSLTIHSNFISSDIVDSRPTTLLNEFFTKFGNGPVNIDYEKKIFDTGTFRVNQYLQTLYDLNLLEVPIVITP